MNNVFDFFSLHLKTSPCTIQIDYKKQFTVSYLMIPSIVELSSEHTIPSSCSLLDT